MRRGKLNEKELNSALACFTIQNDEVLFGSGIGEDCAVIAPKGNILITTDPITAVGADISKLIFDVNMNDIYAGGGEPFAALMTVLAPENESAEELIELIKSIGNMARLKGVDIIGGHTEFTDAVTRVVVSMTMFGRVTHPIVNKVSVGDKLIATKYLGLEATSILLNTIPSGEVDFTPEELEKYNRFNDFSVARESHAVRELGSIHAMHDITEGGVYGACCELAKTSNLGVDVYADSLPILPITSKLCAYKGYNVGYIISSGSMLLATNNSQEVIATLENNGVKATVIGEITESGYFAVSGDTRVEISVRCDELFNI